MQEKSVHSVNIILSRLRSALKLSTDTKLSDYLGIDKSTLSAWKRRNTIDYDLIFTNCKHLNYDWIITGSGEMLRNNHPPNNKNNSDDPLSEFSDIHTVNQILKSTEKALKHSETALEQAKSEIESRKETNSLLIDKIRYLEDRLSKFESP